MNNIEAILLGWFLGIATPPLIELVNIVTAWLKKTKAQAGTLKDKRKHKQPLNT